jgi:hypothetical protein
LRFNPSPAVRKAAGFGFFIRLDKPLAVLSFSEGSKAHGGQSFSDGLLIAFHYEDPYRMTARGGYTGMLIHLLLREVKDVKAGRRKKGRTLGEFLNEMQDDD